MYKVGVVPTKIQVLTWVVVHAKLNTCDMIPTSPYVC